MHKKIYFVVSTLILAVLLISSVNGVFAQSKQSALVAVPTQKVVTRTVTVTGSGQEYLAPDLAYITIVVITDGDDPDKAVTAKNTRAQAVKDALVALGVDEKDIQTTNFEIYPQPEYDSAGNPTEKTKYIVNNSIFVTIRDVSVMGNALNAAFQAGARAISSIRFDVGEMARGAAFSKARESAVSNAREKADELAVALDVRVGDVQTITESTSIESQQMNSQSSSAQTAGGTTDTGQGGQILLTVEVKIVYEIMPIPEESPTPTPKK